MEMRTIERKVPAGRVRLLDCGYLECVDAWGSDRAGPDGGGLLPPRVGGRPRLADPDVAIPHAFRRNLTGAMSRKVHTTEEERLEARRESRRRWAEANPEKVKASANAWRKTASPERLAQEREASRLRIAKKYQTTPGYAERQEERTRRRKVRQEALKFKLCRTCGKSKDRQSAFGKTPGGKTEHSCMGCVSERPARQRILIAERRADPQNKAIHRRLARDWYERNRRDAFSSARRSALGKYGLTQAQHYEMVREQQGRCSICDEVPKKGSLCVDHDHSTGAVRGIICRRCNVGIGQLQDRIDVVESALTYLKSARDRRAS